MALLVVSFSLLIEDQGLVKVDLSAILDPFDFKVYVISFGYIILSKVVLCPFPFCFRSKLSCDSYKGTNLVFFLKAPPT